MNSNRIIAMSNSTGKTIKYYTPIEFSYYLGTNKFKNPFTCLSIYGLSKDYLKLQWNTAVDPKNIEDGLSYPYSISLIRSSKSLDELEPKYLFTYIDGLFPGGEKSDHYSREQQPDNLSSVIKNTRHDIKAAFDNRDNEQITGIIEFAQVIKQATKESVSALAAEDSLYLYRVFPYAYAFDLADSYYKLFDSLPSSGIPVEFPSLEGFGDDTGPLSERIGLLITKIAELVTPPKRFPWSR